jgi:hypothetical protein
MKNDPLGEVIGAPQFKKIPIEIIVVTGDINFFSMLINHA